MTTLHEKLKEHMQANLLDGDEVQAGQMIASTEVLSYLTELADSAGLMSESQWQKKAIEEGWKEPGKRKHLMRNKHGTFCGYGAYYGVEVVEIVEDATCKRCIRLKAASGLEDKE